MLRERSPQVVCLGLSAAFPFWGIPLRFSCKDRQTTTENSKQQKALLYTSDGTVTYAQRLFVSEPSSSGRFNVLKACEGSTDEIGLCWAVILVDREAGKVQKISIAKYSGQNWVQWSTDERYAVFAESMEGVTWFIVLDLQTGESKMFDYTPAPADLSSFSWVSDRTFQANFLCDADCAEPPFQGDITELFAQ